MRRNEKKIKNCMAVAPDVWRIWAISCHQTTSLHEQFLSKYLVWEELSLPASPVHCVMRILICFTLKLSCHMFKFSSSSSHFSIASPIFAFICFPNPASIGWTLSVGFSGSRYKWWHWSRFCAFHESSSLFVSKYYYQDQTLVKTRRGAKNPKLLVTCYITVFLWSTSKRRGTWPILYLFFGVHRPYFTSWVDLSQYGQYAPPLNARHLYCDLEGNQRENLSFKLTLIEEKKSEYVWNEYSSHWARLPCIYW